MHALAACVKWCTLSQSCFRAMQGTMLRFLRMLKPCNPFQAAAAAVGRTAASEADSKNGRLDRALMRLDRALDPKRYVQLVFIDAPYKRSVLSGNAFRKAGRHDKHGLPDHNAQSPLQLL